MSFITAPHLSVLNDHANIVLTGHEQTEDSQIVDRIPSLFNTFVVVNNHTQ